MKILIRKDSRLDMERQYMWSAYNKAIEEAENYTKVEGVRENIKAIEQDADAYRERLRGFLESQRAAENENYSNFELAANRYNIGVWVGVGIIIVRFLLYFLMMAGYLEWLYVVGHLVTLVYIVMFPILLIKAKILEKRYRSYVRDTLGQIDQINVVFLRKVSAFENKVDQLYLNSLDPFQRRQELNMRKQDEERKKDEQWKNEMLNEQKQIGQSQKRIEGHTENIEQVLSKWNEEYRR